MWREQSGLCLLLVFVLDLVCYLSHSLLYAYDDVRSMQVLLYEVLSMNYILRI